MAIAKVVLRYNEKADKCEVELRTDSLKGEDSGETFGNEIPEDGVDVIETEDGQTVIVFHEGAGPGAYLVTSSEVFKLETEEWEEPEEYFAEDESDAEES